VQPLGIPASFGGPTCGYFATTQKWMRRMPGRIVGQTVDRGGARGFVLTLQTREQHIRREKATSNICSNQALMALAASVYLSVMGKQGFREAAYLNVQKAHYALEKLEEAGFQRAFAAPFFNEFAVKMPAGVTVNEVNQKLLRQGIIGGYDLGRDDPELAGHMLIAVTEQRTRSEIDQLIKGMRDAG
jgi:glycine dehydrogenase subunit 1